MKSCIKEINEYWKCGLNMLVWSIVGFFSLSAIGIGVEKYFGLNKIDTSLGLCYVDTVDIGGGIEIERERQEKERGEGPEGKGTGSDIDKYS